MIMLRVKIFFLLWFIPWFLTSCGGVFTEENDVGRSGSSSVPVTYARGFRVVDSLGVRLVTMHDTQDGSTTPYRYALVPRGDSSVAVPDGYLTIYTPVERVVCMTTLQMGNFLKLNAEENIVGMSSTRYLFSERMREQIEKGHTRRIGIEGNFDTETILAIQPDLILVSPFKRGGFDALKHLGIPLVTFLGYKESSPLGQAEWVKFVGMLLGKEREAIALFDSTVARYNALKELVAEEGNRPVVMSGELHGGNWYVVGGKSYLANQIRDAGGDYFIHNDSTGGYYVDFEKVYSQGAGAEYWRILNSYDGEYTYDVLASTDSRYVDFQPFKNKKVIYCNLRQKPFYELAPVEPDVVLADLIKALHPDLLVDYEPVYYILLAQ